ncbi:MAG: hypothetical protein COU11_01510 [Candidatus Harrisonbacteria bacterium CG10_big_fil_rev_8_21_14_0_10_49_15]|uniref:HD/PDEase domain-containing protein n=1 Tax=Candidatus Harrisonbacteria bacterium CG10_big_fil_rev_8_21_14_0_10_49_15 TaxID=1974587 RepID=A0A2H0ULC0_9BACT|nr:MAG: hypothetical protein COU11_01510 [Candidatus Harrisonbacteria bacterium CG10_big_fil_rev_8_21_14_0_10_49_15]
MEISKEVLQIAEILKQNGHQAYLVGGCLRDLIMEREPNDWDVATDAKPDVLLELFPDSVYENEFGTVGVKTESTDPKLKVIEVTTFRVEEAYTDKRRPDKVHFTKKIEDDLSRRDFTMNALALSLTQSDAEILDPYGGLADIQAQIIRAVRDPHERFSEDALRLMRAVRFSAQLGFKIEKGTESALAKHAPLLAGVSQERIRDELTKLVMSSEATEGIRHMVSTDLLKYVIPELLEGVNCEQNKHHIYDVFEHNLKSLEYSVNQNYSLVVRLASLLHDVGKPATRRWKSDPRGAKQQDGKAGDWTFYGHQVVGAKISKKILQRLKYSKEIIERASLLVREHMFVYDPEVVTLAGVRRLRARVGDENLEDLIKVREADRIGSGVPKAQPYRLRYLQAMLEKVKTDPISPKMLAIDGGALMTELGIQPGPRLGHIIAGLLESVLEDPNQNTKDNLLSLAKTLNNLSDKELEQIRAKGKEKAEATQEYIDEEIKKKYFVT